MKRIRFFLCILMALTLFFTGCKPEIGEDDNHLGGSSGETFEVAFQPNGGEGEMEPQTFVDKKSDELKSNIFTLSDFAFTGWNRKADGTGAYYWNRQIIVVSSNMDLYAQWADPKGKGQPCPGTPTVTDLDGNVYQTVQIGSQCWMRENLRTTKYNNGENIPVLSDKNAWMNSVGAMCYYQNDPANALVFGAIYNGYTARRGILCPEGWHVPDNDEWSILVNELGGENKAGYKMKALSHWLENNADNESSFTAYPAGKRNGSPDANFFGLNEFTEFWSSTRDSDNIGNYAKRLIWNTQQLDEGQHYGKNIGLSVRCIKD